MTRSEIFVSVTILYGIIQFAGCASVEGEDGMPFLAITWNEKPAFYSDNNPSIPEGIIQEKFYETFPQTASFEYGYSDGYGWTGTYQIMEGEPGTDGIIFLRQGDDGLDNYYTLRLAYLGSEFTNEYRKEVAPDSFTVVTQKGSTYFVVNYRKIRRDNGFKPAINKLSH